MTFPLLLLKQLSKIRHLMRVASYIPQRFWKKHFLSRMELPQITTKTLREILWFNYMEQMIFLLNSMDVIEGTIDWEALKPGTMYCML